MNSSDTLRVVAEELAAAMERHGFEYGLCEGRPCGHVALSFESVFDADGFLAAAVPAGGPGSLRDRACGGLLSLTELEQQGVSPEDPRAVAAFTSGWAWTCYPEFSQTGAVRWHMAADLDVEDAAELAANLNAAYRTAVS